MQLVREAMEKEAAMVLHKNILQVEQTGEEDNTVHTETWRTWFLSVFAEQDRAAGGTHFSMTSGMNVCDGQAER